MAVATNTRGVFRGLLDRGRRIQVSRSAGIIAVIAVIALVMLGYYLFSNSSPSVAQVHAEQEVVADKFSKWAAAREDARKQTAVGRRFPNGTPQKPAGR